MAGGTMILWRVREEHLFSLSLSRLRRYPIATSSYLRGDWEKDRTKLFSEVLSCNSKGNSGWSAIKKKFFVRGGAASEHGPREVMEYPSLEVLSAQLDTALRNLLCTWSCPAVSRRWDQMTSRGKVLSHLNSSMILTCLMTCVLRY